jgi:hypothetical protein
LCEDDLFILFSAPVDEEFRPSCCQEEDKPTETDVLSVWCWPRDQTLAVFDNVVAIVEKLKASRPTWCST